MPHRAPVVLLCALLVLAGCSGSGSGSRTHPGALAASGIDLHGQTYTVGGKEFSEQLVLCKMQIAALQSVGATVRDRCNIPGSTAARSALTTGQIDMYWSYTGTGWVVDLGRRTPTIHDADEQYRAVRDADAANGIVWTAPAPFNDTYAIATTRDVARRHGLRTVSDFARLVNAGDPDATLCVEPEFAARPDGLDGLRQAYRIGAPFDGPPRVTTLDGDAVYDATAHGSPCRFGEVFTTDGRVTGLGLQPLVDDRDHFPKYNASNTIRRQVVDRDPRVVRLSDELARRLDDRTMLDLNGQVSSQGRDPDLVARTWLTQQGLIGR